MVDGVWTETEMNGGALRGGVARALGRRSGAKDVPLDALKS